jgi:hypothetical protein
VVFVGGRDIEGSCCALATIFVPGTNISSSTEQTVAMVLNLDRFISSSHNYVY